MNPIQPSCFSQRLAQSPSASRLFFAPPLCRRFFAVLLAGCATIGANAQQNDGAVTSSTPPQVFQPSPAETSDTGPSLGPSGRSTSLFFGGSQYSDLNGRSNRSPGPFFLPALLPVLGAPSPASAVPLAADYPGEFAGEPFFMAYGNLLARNLVSDKRTERISRYRSARLALLTELRDQLSRVLNASIEAREQALSEFAAIQTPRLLELEAEAEAIRHDLTASGVFTTTAHDIGDVSPTNKAPEFIDALNSLRLILSAAHYRDGLSLDQRRLLEEMAIETQLAIEPEPAPDGPAPVFFWPAGARIPVPTGLPTDVAGKFEAFQQLKAALKDELRAALEREANRVFNVDRTDSYARLAVEQARRFAELDTLADQIRPALASLLAASKTSDSELPDDIARQVAALVDHKAALQREVHARLMQFRRELPSDRIELIRNGDGLAISIMTDNSHRRDRESVLSRIKAFNAEIPTRFATLAADRDTVRAAIARYRSTTAGVDPDLTVEQLAADFLVAYKAREIQRRQRDYAAAVLAPGLSPAQRRLLLTAASSDLLPERHSRAH